MSFTAHELLRRVHRLMALEREEFARRLVTLREHHTPPLNKDQAARLIGTDPRHYHRWERGEVMPYLSTITKIATAYGVDTSYLIIDAAELASPPPAHGDLQRIEKKLDLILAHHGIDYDAEPAATDLPPPPPELVQKPPTRRPKRTKPRAPRKPPATQKQRPAKQ